MLSGSYEIFPWFRLKETRGFLVCSLGALRAVPRNPVRALALLRAVPRAEAAGGAVAAAFEVLLVARRHHGQAPGRHAVRAAAPLAEQSERLRAVGAKISH